MAKFDRNFVEQALKKGIGSLGDSSRVRASFDLCYDAHLGQFRESAREEDDPLPYILHPVGVSILAHKFYDEANIEDELETLLIAALAHDVLEDTSVTPADLSGVCGERVAELVSIMTKPQIGTDESNIERNRRFRDQIILGGTTTMFIKVCDSLHNLSRPKQSPQRVLEKAVRKASSDYLKFFSEGLQCHSLERRYNEQISEVSEFVSELRSRSTLPKAASLAELAEMAHVAVQKKAIEIHDVINFLETRLDLNFARLFNREDLETLLFDLRKGEPNPKQVKNITSKLKEGKLTPAQLPKKVRNTDLLRNADNLLIFSADRLLIGSQSADRFLMLGYKVTPSSDWYSFEGLGVVLSFLTQKTRDASRHEFEDLARSAQSLGISATPIDLEQSGMSYPRLLKLREMYRSANALEQMIRNEIGLEIDALESVELAAPVETRVKLASSLLRKIIARGFSSFAQVDDFIGFRLVCTNSFEKRQLQSICEKIALRHMPGKNGMTNGALFRDVSSKAGYSAAHMNFACSCLTTDEHTIGCEIQIRTVFEDAWARLSTAHEYKSGTKSNANERLLKELAKLRIRGDDLADKL